MKPRKLDEKKIFRDILLAITVLAGFIFVVSFSSQYVSNAINQGLACSCIVPIPIMILLLSSLGVFVGTLVYYLLSSRFVRERKEYTEDIMSILRFLDNDEKLIIKELIKARGKINQSELVKNTLLNKIKVSRMIKILQSKQVLFKKQHGKLNKIYLADDLRRLMIKD